MPKIIEESEAEYAGYQQIEEEFDAQTSPTEKIFRYLKQVGGKASGGQVREALDLRRTEFDSAKQELKEAGTIILGRGRGGTITLVDGAEAPKEKPKKSKADIARGASESRQANIRIRAERDKIANKALEIAEKEFPDADKLEVQVWTDWGKCYVTVWEGKKANVYSLTVEEQE